SCVALRLQAAVPLLTGYFRMFPRAQLVNGPGRRVAYEIVIFAASAPAPAIAPLRLVADRIFAAQSHLMFAEVASDGSALFVQRSPKFRITGPRPGKPSQCELTVVPTGLRSECDLGCSILGNQPQTWSSAWYSRGNRSASRLCAGCSVTPSAAWELTR